MITNIPNPKKEFTINYGIDEVKSAIHKLVDKDCVVHKDDPVLNEIILQDKESVGFGYLVSFVLVKKADKETQVTVEVSKHLGALTSTTATSANNKLKRFSDNLSNALQGKELTKPAGGCMVVMLAGAASLLYWLV